MWISVLAIAVGLSAGANAATIDELVTPPRELLGAPLDTQDVTSEKTIVVSGGVHKGHTALDQPSVRFTGCPVGYALGYNVCLQRDAHPRMVDVWPREGGLGIGMVGPNSPNWYSGGFIDLLINGVSPGPRKARITRTRYAQAESVIFTWDAPEAKVDLVFTATAKHDCLFLEGVVEPKRRIHSLQVALTCYPSAFATPRDRWIATGGREVQHTQTVTLAPQEPWVLCYDAHFDEALRPGDSCGPAAVMFSPLQVRKARVKVAEYPVTVSLDLYAHIRQFNLALWDFRDTTNADALTHMRSLTAGIDATELPVVTQNVPERALVVDGKAAATLVVPADPSPQELAAAQEIQDAVVDMSRALLPVKNEGRQVEGNRVLIGNTAQAREHGYNMPLKPVGEAGFGLKTVGRDVYITAEHPTATLYGACELLENLGMRWYLPGPLGTVAPQQPTLIVPELDQTQRPTFPMRWIGRDSWGYRNKCNRRIGSDPGGQWGFGIRPGVYHADYKLLPVDEYYEEHPEYFALVKGERCSKQDTKLCVSNPDVVRQVARNMGKLLDEDPSIDLIGLAPTDGTNYCECEPCVAMDDVGERPADQKYSRRMLLFYNAVARELAKTHPDAQILAGAYHWYNQPPLDTSISAEPNLSLVICHYTEYCSMHEIERADCPRNARYLDLLNRWSALIPDIYFYEYYYTDGFRQLPCNLVHAIRRDLPFKHRRGFKGVYTQYGNIWNTHLNYYIAAKLLWDVHADVDALLDDFYHKFYAEAAGPMKAYYELISRILDETSEHLCTCSGVGKDMRQIFTPDVVSRMRAHYEEAVSLAEDELVKARLEKIGLSIDYTERFMQYLDEYTNATMALDPDLRKHAAAKAVQTIEALYGDVVADPGRYSGVVAPGSYHWRGDLRRARVLAARQKVVPGAQIGKLPDKWRFATDPQNQGVQQRWYEPEFDDSEWQTLLATKHWEDQGHKDYDGHAWYRTSLTLTAEHTAKPVSLHFAGVDAEAWVYLEGKQIGHHDGWDVPFAILIPADMAVADKPMTLAVRVYDGANKGGMYGPVTLLRPE